MQALTSIHQHAPLSSALVDLLAALFFVGFAYLSVRMYRKDRDGAWHRHYAIWKKIFDPKARENVHIMMRRYVDGRWEYRPMTSAELASYEADEAW